MVAQLLNIHVDGEKVTPEQVLPLPGEPLYAEQLERLAKQQAPPEPIEDRIERLRRLDPDKFK